MRGRRRLGRALIFVGVVSWIPELWIAWVIASTLFTPIRAPNGQVAHIQIHLNGSAWALGIVWTLLCWALMGWGVRILLKASSMSGVIGSKLNHESHEEH